MKRFLLRLLGLMPEPLRHDGCHCERCRDQKLPVLTHEEPHCFKTPREQWPALLWEDEQSRVWVILAGDALAAPPVFNLPKHDLRIVVQGETTPATPAGNLIPTPSGDRRTHTGPFRFLALFWALLLAGLACMWATYVSTIPQP